MPDLNKKELNDTVEYYIKNKDYVTAENFILSHGPQIKDYNMEEELYKLKQVIKEE